MSNKVHNAQIFISYASEDRKKVRKICSRLKSAGFNPWLDVEKLKVGEDWKNAIRREIKYSSFFLICLSVNSVEKRGTIRHEIKQALEEWEDRREDDIYFLPVKLDNCKTPNELSGFHWVELYKSRQFQKLIQALQFGIDRLEMKPEVTNDPFTRVNYILDDFRKLSILDKRQLKREVVRYSGFLSALAISENDPFKKMNADLHTKILEERNALLDLARSGCRLKCIIAPPHENFIIPKGIPIAKKRIDYLIEFISSSDKAVQNIDWTISPLRQKNIYIIGNKSFIEGLKEEVKTGYSLTLRQTGMAVECNIELFDSLFEPLEAYTIGKYFNTAVVNRENLRLAVLNCLYKTRDLLKKY